MDSGHGIFPKQAGVVSPVLLNFAETKKRFV